MDDKLKVRIVAGVLCLLTAIFAVDRYIAWMILDHYYPDEDYSYYVIYPVLLSIASVYLLISLVRGKFEI